jgi:hypothetical protein
MSLAMPGPLSEISILMSSPSRKALTDSSDVATSRMASMALSTRLTMT